MKRLGALCITLLFFFVTDVRPSHAENTVSNASRESGESCLDRRFSEVMRRSMQLPSEYTYETTMRRFNAITEDFKRLERKIKSGVYSARISADDPACPP